MSSPQVSCAQHEGKGEQVNRSPSRRLICAREPNQFPRAAAPEPQLALLGRRVRQVATPIGSEHRRLFLLLCGQAVSTKPLFSLIQRTLAPAPAQLLPRGARAAKFFRFHAILDRLTRDPGILRGTRRGEGGAETRHRHKISSARVPQ